MPSYGVFDLATCLVSFPASPAIDAYLRCLRSGDLPCELPSFPRNRCLPTVSSIWRHALKPSQLPQKSLPTYGVFDLVTCREAWSAQGSPQGSAQGNAQVSAQVSARGVRKGMLRGVFGGMLTGVQGGAGTCIDREKIFGVSFACIASLACRLPCCIKSPLRFFHIRSFFCI